MYLQYYKKAIAAGACTFFRCSEHTAVAYVILVRQTKKTNNGMSSGSGSYDRGAVTCHDFSTLRSELYYSIKKNGFEVQKSKTS